MNDEHESGSDADATSFGSRVTRRDFLAAGIAAGAAIALPGCLSADQAKPVRIGIVGVGNRGYSLMHVLFNFPAVRVTAVADIDPVVLRRAETDITNQGKGKPAVFGNGPEDFRRLVQREDVDVVLIATPWECHAPIALAAMRSGKNVAAEVPGSVTVEQAWELVETSEKTRRWCMLLENVCYYRPHMAVLRMVRAGVFGEMIHAEAGYQHDIRDGAYLDSSSNLRWRGQYAARRNGSLYPTHAVGPVAHWLDINRGNRFTRLVSMSSKARGINSRVRKRAGASHQNARTQFANGDVNTTLLQTESGATVTIYHDTTLPRPYDLIMRVQGTDAIYHGTLGKLYVEPQTQPFDGNSHASWQDPEPYFARYEHPMWAEHGTTARKFGHEGGDYMQLLDLVTAVQRGSSPMIDVYDLATWSAVGPLSEQSVRRGSAPVDFPDFTRGRWKKNKPIFGV
jgi:predicted dehydrogenase